MGFAWASFLERERERESGVESLKTKIRKLDSSPAFRTGNFQAVFLLPQQISSLSQARTYSFYVEEKLTNL
jgi:hypothetical protein